MADTLIKRQEGRPTSKTEETVSKLESIFKIGGNIEEACSYALISKESYYRWLREDDRFQTKMEAAQHYSDVAAKNIIIDAIVKDKDIGSAKWWLEKREYKNTGTNVAVQINSFQETAKQQREKYK